MHSQRSVLKPVHFEALFFIFLLIFSLIFAGERIINSDAAFYFFKLVNFGHFNIEHGRYSAFISQLPLLAGVKAGLNLKILLYIYSATFVILFWLVYFLIRNGLKNRPAALALVMVIAVGVTDSIYRPVSESTQGLVYALILFAVLYYPFPKTKTGWQNIIRIVFSALIILLCYYAHPLTIFPVLFIIGFYIIDRSKWKSYLPWLLILFVILLYSVKFLTTKESSYEGNKLGGLDTFIQNLPAFFRLYSTKYLANRLLSVYLVSLFLFLALNVYYLYKRNYLKWIFTNVFILGFVIIYNLDYYQGGSGIEMDKNLMTLNFLIFLPFAADIFYDKNFRNRQRNIFMLLLLIFSVIVILHPRETFSQRIKYYGELNRALQKQDGSKFYTESDNISKKVLFLWSVPFESLLVSSLDGPEYSKTIYPFNDINNLPDYIGDPDLFLCTTFWQHWRIEDLNRRYFRLPEQPYRYLAGDLLPGD